MSGDLATSIQPQLRLTKKMAKDLKISTLSDPQPLDYPMADWTIDVITVQRRKVAMATNVASLTTILIPYSSVGGAIAVPGALGDLVVSLLKNLDFVEQGKRVAGVFQNPSRFCKTSNRKVISHMTDFKRMIEGVSLEAPFSEIDWNDVSSRLNKMLVGDGAGGYQTPLELMRRVLLCSVAKI